MQITARKQAIESKLTRFFTGIPCGVGHIAERLTSSGECVECKRSRERNSTNAHTYKKVRYSSNRERFIEEQKQRDKNRTSEIQAYQTAWRKKNKNQIKEYRKQNLALYASHRAARRAAQIQATPPWCEREQIKLLYDLANKLTKETGVVHVVHHIIPLREFPEVCGLHCLANLVIVTENEHKRLHTLVDLETMISEGMLLITAPRNRLG